VLRISVIRSEAWKIKKDYDKAQKIKGEIERIRASADHIISNINNPYYRANSALKDEVERQIS
jgi:hypothetical protein